MKEVDNLEHENSLVILISFVLWYPIVLDLKNGHSSSPNSLCCQPTELHTGPNSTHNITI